LGFRVRLVVFLVAVGTGNGISGMVVVDVDASQHPTPILTEQIWEGVFVRGVDWTNIEWQI